MICLHISFAAALLGQFPSELQTPVNISFKVEIPLGVESTGSTHKAMGTPLRLLVT